LLHGEEKYQHKEFFQMMKQKKCKKEKRFSAQYLVQRPWMIEWKTLGKFFLFILLIGCLSFCKTSGGNGNSNDNNNNNTTNSPYQISVYDASKAYRGTTLFTTNYDGNNPKVVKVDMNGNVVWEYLLPDEVKQYTQPGFDAEQLTNGNILIVLPGYGIYEIDNNGTLIWNHLDAKISHDADRLSNGNTLYVFGNNDTKNDDHAKEVDTNGNLVWSWSARTSYDVDPFRDIYDQGWTHANAVIRLSNGNTLVSLRNFNLSVEVTVQGPVAWSFDWTQFGAQVDPHEPEILSNGNLLVALQRDSPFIAVEINRTTGQTVWTYSRDNIRTTRDADRLPNGNTLLVAVDTAVAGSESLMFEVTSAGEIVWEMRLVNHPVETQPGFFYKAQRL
jgi:hypothetical protein